ncbi:hypothetical protein EYC98_14305 [Halieaceae bacterium IMCC14734]|uniref:Outer membrane protein beta-barrel domain-containing protein n=1 Tax=Candidatus Litorirhabdus singularis TaxID=2518993 RepID=A0ABT3TI74_9GAMM|nr:acyloxyacyl hydrolase [Candidatus Litorirhabdus singularis]MCX2982032.1 hypothetical protein [Candidatus Litorirhabdus singularis]
MKYIFPLLLFACVTPTAFAADLTILAGYQTNPDFKISAVGPAEDGDNFDDLALDDGPSLSIAWDFVFKRNPDQRIGFYLSHQQTDFDTADLGSDTGMKITHVHFTGTSYYPNGKMEPFVSAGVGVGIFAPEDSDLSSETKFSAQIAAGTNYKFTENLLLRFDIRWLPTFFNGSSAIFCNGGCVIRAESDTYSQIQANIGLMFRY